MAAPRVLHVYRTYFPDTQGGLEETIRQICHNTKPLGIESTVYTTSTNPIPGVIDRPEATVVRVKKSLEIASCSIAFDGSSTFRELCASADVVHYHFPWPFADFLHLTSPPSTPSIVTYHSDIVRQKLLNVLYQPIMHRFLQRVDRIVCTSPNYFATSSVLSRFSDKVDVIPIGLDEKTYPQADSATLEETRANYGEKFFLFVGVLRYYKGLHILLEAMQNAPYRVVIAGSGPTEQELRKKAESLKLDNLLFAGRVTDQTKMALFELSCGVVFPSYLRSEAFGITLLEGAMHSRPLISTEVGSGTSHINKHNETGFVVTPGSAKALRQAMDKLHTNPGVADQFGRNARTRYEELFTGQRMAAGYAKIYENLTSCDR